MSRMPNLKYLIILRDVHSREHSRRNEQRCLSLDPLAADQFIEKYLGVNRHVLWLSRIPSLHRQVLKVAEIVEPKARGDWSNKLGGVNVLGFVLDA